jgi:hypothetical protein
VLDWAWANRYAEGPWGSRRPRKAAPRWATRPVGCGIRCSRKKQGHDYSSTARPRHFPSARTAKEKASRPLLHSRCPHVWSPDVVVGVALRLDIDDIEAKPVQAWSPLPHRMRSSGPGNTSARPAATAWQTAPEQADLRVTRRCRPAGCKPCIVGDLRDLARRRRSATAHRL